MTVGLVESTYAPQISIEAIDDFQRTPLPIPTTLIPKGYFTSDTRELVPSMARADADKEDAHANVFTAAAALVFATGAMQIK